MSAQTAPAPKSQTVTTRLPRKGATRGPPGGMGMGMIGDGHMCGGRMGMGMMGGGMGMGGGMAMGGMCHMGMGAADTRSTSRTSTRA